MLSSTLSSFVNSFNTVRNIIISGYSFLYVYHLRNNMAPQLKKKARTPSTYSSKVSSAPLDDPYPPLPQKVVEVNHTNHDDQSASEHHVITESQQSTNTITSHDSAYRAHVDAQFKMIIDRLDRLDHTPRPKVEHQPSKASLKSKSLDYDPSPPATTDDEQPASPDNQSHASYHSRTKHDLPHHYTKDKHTPSELDDYYSVNRNGYISSRSRYSR